MYTHFTGNQCSGERARHELQWTDRLHRTYKMLHAGVACILPCNCILGPLLVFVLFCFGFGVWFCLFVSLFLFCNCLGVSLWKGYCVREKHMNREIERQRQRRRERERERDRDRDTERDRERRRRRQTGERERLRTQKLRFPLLSLKVCRYSHAWFAHYQEFPSCPNFYIPCAFAFIFFQILSLYIFNYFSLANTVSRVGPQNKIDLPSHSH